MTRTPKARIRLAALSATAVVLALLPAGAISGKVPATGTPLTAGEKAEGAKYHPQLLEEFGGAVTGPQADYVKSVAKTVSVQSGLSASRDDFTVTLLNSPVNNAFAIPGGYVYVTRQLVALMNNEAELAGVLGHEVGHVAARHSAKRQAKAQQNQLLGVLGQVLSGVVLGNSALGQLGQQVASTVPQLVTLRYSRKQELKADKLGVQYLKGAGYDARAMATVLQNLAAQNALDASLRGTSASVPEWASTHPDPASRVKSALALAGTDTTGTVSRDTFLGKISGLMYGDDPAQGVVEGRTFKHPDLRLAFDAPEGFALSNGATAVSISGGSGKGEFGTGAYSGNLDSYIRSVFTALAGEGQALAPTSVTRTTVNGINAAYGTARVTTQSGEVDVVVYAYEFAGDRAFHFTTLAAAGGAAVFSPMFQSMRRLSATDAAAITPRRVEVVTVRKGDTVASLAARMGYSDGQAERFRVLNGLSATDSPAVGQKVKIVVKASR